MVSFGQGNYNSETSSAVDAYLNQVSFEGAKKGLILLKRAYALPYQTTAKEEINAP